MTGAQQTQLLNGGHVAHCGKPRPPSLTQVNLVEHQQVTKVTAQPGHTSGPVVNKVSASRVVMSKPGTVAVPNTGTPGTVPISSGMQIINMRGQAIQSKPGGQPLPPRMTINQVQVLPPGVRPGAPGQQITLGTLQGLPPGAQGHLLVKTENGQLQLLRVNTQPGQISGTPNVTQTTAIPQQTTAYRFQQPLTQHTNMGTKPNVRINPVIGIFSLKSNFVANSVALSTATSTTTMTGSHGVSATGTPVTLPITSTTGVPNSITSTLPSHPQNPQPIQQQQTQQSTQPVASQTISAESAKTKCKNFLATLLKLANEQRAPVARNVRHLIQGLIDARVEPEAFTEELQKDLNSSPQPCLVPFLKKTLPYLRVSLARGELTIDGVKAPSLNAVPPVPGMTTQIPTMNVARSTPPVSGTVRMVTPSNIRPQTTMATPSRVVTTGSMQQVRMQGGKTVVTTVRQQGPSGISQTPTFVSSQSTVSQKNINTTPIPKFVSIKDKDPSRSKEKYNFGGGADDDINDVAAMGGVNLEKEEQRILDSTGFVGMQIRSCKDENFLFSGPLQQRIRQMCTKYGLEEPPKEVVSLVSHATQERLKTIVEKLAVISEHRLDIIKSEQKYEIRQDVKGQLRFLEELDKLEKKRKDEQERETLMRAARSRGKSEDPEQAKLKAKAKEMQRVEMEEMRQRDANLTALKALQGPKKKPKLDLPGMDQGEGATYSGTFTNKQMPLRPRIKRVNLRDLVFLMEQEKELKKSPVLYRSYLK
ncbi:unnamed protein product, partial [Meganyctiphanes norvegica]